MRAAGGVLIGVGAVLVLIVYIWGRSGYYDRDVPAMVILTLLGVGGLALGAYLVKKNTPAGARGPVAVASLVPPVPQPAPAAAGGHPWALAASDPATPLEKLADLAHSEPELRPLIAANPSTYPDLLVWLGSLGDPAVDAALTARQAADGLVAEASDPSTTPARLAALAYEQPHLRTAIAANPSAYDGLRDWITAAESGPQP